MRNEIRTGAYPSAQSVCQFPSLSAHRCTSGNITDSIANMIGYTLIRFKADSLSYARKGIQGILDRQSICTFRA
ncbi:hypothetical protein GQ43DRAFT_442128 [Delitschia confertaspora ATCC 74209]|uniref:Uncharacterized protein n=1 Tax=Delitschia confertaspora ATCC 74209 TaxID=1513339 RepID=A0A9P4JN36_9PLEO|nr:hypothetical protein GQ43DRAFT_442128 [Delitschia confertaspora ATCC 74209]